LGQSPIKGDVRFPEDNYWRDSKFVGCADAILNFGILQIRVKHAEILMNQNLGHYNRKPNINQVLI
jgi:hypothetical protein